MRYSLRLHWWYYLGLSCRSRFKSINNCFCLQKKVVFKCSNIYIRIKIISKMLFWISLKYYLFNISYFYPNDTQATAVVVKVTWYRSQPRNIWLVQAFCLLKKRFADDHNCVSLKTKQMKQKNTIYFIETIYEKWSECNQIDFFFKN